MSNSKQWKLFFFKFFLITIICFVVSLYVDNVYRHTYRLVYHVPQHLLPNPPREKPYQVVKTGNSHSLDGITFKYYKIESLDLAGAAQRFETDLALLKQHAKEIDKNALIIIPVTPISFSHTAINTQRGFQIGYYDRVSPIYIPHLNWGDFIESEFFPFVRSANAWRRAYADALKEKISAEERWIEPASGEIVQSSPEPSPKVRKKVLVQRMPLGDYYFNVAAIQAELASPAAVPQFGDNTVFMYNKWLHTDEFSPHFFDDNRRDLEKLLGYCLKQGWRPVLITIPISEQFVKVLPSDYMEKNLYENIKKANTHGVEYIDYSNYSAINSNKALFSNVDHLNASGRAIFSYILLQDLVKRGYLSKEVDGYDYGPIFEEVWQ